MKGLTGKFDVDEVDKLAALYAQTLDTGTFEELYKRMYPVVRMDARRHFLNVGGFGITYEDLESHLLQTVYEAALRYKGPHTQEHFTTTYRGKAKQVLIDLIREKKAKKRGREFTTVTLLETKNMAYWIEDIIINRLEAKKMLEGFVTKAPKQYGNIIGLIVNGYSNKEIARVMGDDHYSPKIRKTVSRAKKTYRQYCETELSKVC